MNKQNTILNNIKALSIIAVVLYHVISLFMESMPSSIRMAANYGSSGVLLFFFASGYGLYYSQAYNEKNYLSYIAHRVKKIYIPYAIVVLVSALFPIMRSNSAVMDVLANILQFGTYIPKYFNTLGGHFWYIGTLLQFYVLFPFLYKTLNQIGIKKYFFLSFVITVGYCSLVALCGLERNQVLIRLFPKYFIEFSLGMIFAKKYKVGVDYLYKLKSSNSLMVLSIAMLGTIITAVSSSTPFGRLLNDLPAFIGLGLLFLLVIRIVENRLDYLLGFINSISYEIYLIHMLVLNIFFLYSDKSLISDIICALCSLLIIVLISYFYHKFLNLIFRKGR